MLNTDEVLGASAFIGLAAGLAILAKQIAFPYLLPFAIFCTVVLFRGTRPRQMLLAVSLTVLLTLAINAGYFTRNSVTYGHPLGSTDKVTHHQNKIHNLGDVISNTVRNASLHAGTPWEAVNYQIFRGIVGLHFKLGMDVNDSRTTVHPFFNIFKPAPDETRSGNPIHAVLILLVTILLTWEAIRTRRRLPFIYLALTALGFIVLGISIRFTLFGSRYHLPFFVLAAPAVGYALGRPKIASLSPTISMILLLCAWPWLSSLQPRPLLTKPKGTFVNSVLVEDRDRLYLALGKGHYEPLKDIVSQIEANECKSVGLMLSGDAPEYPVWAFLGAPSKDLTIRWIVAGVPSAAYSRPDFSPCAVLCDTSCPDDWTDVRGIPQYSQVGTFRLYMAE
jgi:hypothetical protein